MNEDIRRTMAAIQKMRTKQDLEAAVKAARLAYEFAQKELADFEQSAENHRYATIQEGFYLEDDLTDRASEDCEGSYNIGADEYRQEFIVDDKKYVAILYDIEYNRHDKRYYFVDGHKFRVEDEEGNHIKYKD